MCVCRSFDKPSLSPLQFPESGTILLGWMVKNTRNSCVKFHFLIFGFWEGNVLRSCLCVNTQETQTINHARIYRLFWPAFINFQPPPFIEFYIRILFGVSCVCAVVIYSFLKYPLLQIYKGVSFAGVYGPTE